MKFFKKYERTREIHLQPILELAKLGAQVAKNYKGKNIEMLLTPLNRNLRLTEPINLLSSTLQVSYSIGKFKAANYVKVSVEGELKKEELEEIADNIGSVFDKEKHV
ncbi:MAG: hypothetical protein WC438_02190 [Candidatus Pacearchaeota archaeon]